MILNRDQRFLLSDFSNDLAKALILAGAVNLLLENAQFTKEKFWYTVAANLFGLILLLVALSYKQGGHDE